MTPVFVLGVPRSGTTLVRSVMCALPGVYLPPDEFQLLSVILRPDFDLNNLRNILEQSNFSSHMRRRRIWLSQDELTTVSKHSTAAMAFQALVLQLAKKEGQHNIRYWGDKTPENLFHLTDIFETWPDARIVHVVRDPRDTVLSMKRSWGRSVLRGSVLWRDGLRALRRQHHSGRASQIYEIKYESLTNHTNTVLVELAAWLGVEFNPRMVEDFTSEERWSSSKAKGIQNRSVQWKSALPPQEVLTIEQICYVEMQDAGYEPSTASEAKEPPPIQLRLAKFCDAFRVVNAYAKERGWAAAIAYKTRQWSISRKL